ncbi:MAG: KilA-N domain-containing protein [Methylobacter sp.]|nr:MAG: KilA-N domain-containing protein [Methylobacter sp.]
MNTLSLVISNTPIQQDTKGRYCLNDLHKAAGNEKRHQPSNWLQIQQTQELIAELESYDHGITGAKIQAIETIQGKGKQQGTYVVKELVYAYAMWISPAFSLKVIRTFDALVNTPPLDPFKLSYTPEQLEDLITDRIRESSLIPPTGPLTLAQFNAAQQAVSVAQKHLAVVQIIVSAADLQQLKGKAGKVQQAVVFKRWSPEDSDAAQEMQAKGYGPTHIAKLIGDRTANGVKKHLQYLAKKHGGTQ